MRGELDFEAYVLARGVPVVRSLLGLGLGLHEAEASAAEAFASLRPHWRELGQSADPDVVLWATVLDMETRRRRQRNEEPLDETTVAAVLRGIAVLEELQVCDVLGVSVPRLRALLAAAPPDPAPDPDQRDAAVLPVPYARVRAVAVSRKRHRWLLTAGVAAATSLALALGLLLSRPDPVRRPGDVLPPALVTQEADAADVVWWADGKLHLEGSVVRVGKVRRLVAAGTGAAYVDGEGRLVGVTPDGARTLMGLPADGSPLVSSPRLGLVAWADASVPDVTRLVVWDVDAGEEVAAVVTRPQVRPITFDGGWLRFGQGLTDWAWDPSGGPAQTTGNGFADNTALVDAVSGTRLEQAGTFLRVVRAGRRGAARLPGFGGSLSPDGRLVLTGLEQGGSPRLYDARTGQGLGAWAPAGRIVEATFAGAGEIAWLFEQGGELAILSCDPEPFPDCSGFVELGEPDEVLLARDTRR